MTNFGKHTLQHYEVRVIKIYKNKIKYQRALYKIKSAIWEYTLLAKELVPLWDSLKLCLF